MTKPTLRQYVGGAGFALSYFCPWATTSSGVVPSGWVSGVGLMGFGYDSLRGCVLLLSGPGLCSAEVQAGVAKAVFQAAGPLMALGFVLAAARVSGPPSSLRWWGGLALAGLSLIGLSWASMNIVRHSMSIGFGPAVAVLGLILLGATPPVRKAAGEKDG